MIPFPKVQAMRSLESVAILTRSPENELGTCNENISAELDYLFSSPASAKHKTSNNNVSGAFFSRLSYAYSTIESNCKSFAIGVVLKAQIFSNCRKMSMIHWCRVFIELGDS